MNDSPIVNGGASTTASGTEAARLQFQRETLRTSELSQLLIKFIEQHRVIHEPGPWSRSCQLCALVGEAKALLLKPINQVDRTAPETSTRSAEE